MPEEIGVISIWLIIFVIMSILSPSFRTYNNFRLLLLNGSVIAFLALGQAFVLLTAALISLQDQ